MIDDFEDHLPFLTLVAFVKFFDYFLGSLKSPHKGAEWLSKFGVGTLGAVHVANAVASLLHDEAKRLETFHEMESGGED